MSIRAERKGRVVRLSLHGALALGRGARSLRSEVQRHLEDGARRIEIVASGVRFLDAAGLGELVACQELAALAGAELRLVGARGKARELLRITGLDRRLTRRSGPRVIEGLRLRAV